ncbi:MAG: C_GCAxxG_C_C family protein [Clostridia bacterium]|nr:C_GCAxxG_C_C family protein [Clostridia bacterium]MBR6334627.1 C_GCAxxG_C_C family protein [Clostridia bacterium]
MDHSQEAVRLFYEGYNCSQAVFCAFRDLTGLELDCAARLASPFGGGMGRLREVCGTMSGALLALGILKGYDNPENPEAKKEHYALVREFARRFEEKYGALRCKELLKDVPVTPGGEPEARTPEFYKRRPCLKLVEGAAAILDDMLEEMKEEAE